MNVTGVGAVTLLIPSRLNHRIEITAIEVTHLLVGKIRGARFFVVTAENSSEVIGS